jgi:hypothetical protein
LSSGIPHANIAATGPVTRGDFLMLLFWYADTRAVPHVRGIAGLARLTRLALIVGEETGMSRDAAPFFEFHAIPTGGIVSPDLWTELLALRAYQVIQALPEPAATPPEEASEREFMLAKFIPAHERAHYPMPTHFWPRSTTSSSNTSRPASDTTHWNAARGTIFPMRLSCTTRPGQSWRSCSIN